MGLSTPGRERPCKRLEKITVFFGAAMNISTKPPSKRPVGPCFDHSFLHVCVLAGIGFLKVMFQQYMFNSVDCFFGDFTDLPSQVGCALKRTV